MTQEEYVIKTERNLDLFYKGNVVHIVANITQIIMAIAVIYWLFTN